MSKLDLFVRLNELLVWLLRVFLWFAKIRETSLSFSSSSPTFTNNALIYSLFFCSLSEMSLLSFSKCSSITRDLSLRIYLIFSSYFEKEVMKLFSSIKLSRSSELWLLADTTLSFLLPELLIYFIEISFFYLFVILFVVLYFFFIPKNPLIFSFSASSALMMSSLVCRYSSRMVTLSSRSLIRLSCIAFRVLLSCYPIILRLLVRVFSPKLSLDSLPFLFLKLAFCWFSIF